MPTGLVAAPIPSMPTGLVAAPGDESALRLNAIDHIVVLMLENRSFDHRLSYLSLPPDQGGRGRGDIDGLSGPRVNFNSYVGSTYAIHDLDRTELAGEVEDPDHSAASVDEQLQNGGQGFVSNFARISTARAESADQPVPDPGLVMGYYDAEDLPGYDHLAAEYCVVDRWFRSVPGATWPNRLTPSQAKPPEAETTSHHLCTRCRALSATWTSTAWTGAGTHSIPGRCERSIRPTASPDTTALPTSTRAS
jgi:phospholipase C